MKIPSITFVFDRKHTATRTKEAAVELRVTLDRKRVYMSTGVRLCKGQWKNGEVVGRMDCAVLNRLLAGVRLRALEAVEALARGGTLDIRSIPAMLRSRASSMTFPQYVGKRASERPVRASTRGRYLCFKRFLESWRGIVTFSDVSVSSVRAMNECLAASSAVRNSCSLRASVTLRAILSAMASRASSLRLILNIPSPALSIYYMLNFWSLAVNRVTLSAQRRRRHDLLLMSFADRANIRILS